MKILLLGRHRTGWPGPDERAVAHRAPGLRAGAGRIAICSFPTASPCSSAGDFTPDVFKSALSGVDHVIYGIGLPEQFQFDDSVFDKVNCQLLRTFLEALRDSGVRRLTYISTYEVFEVVGNEIDETHPIADESTMTPYFQSMVRAYRIAVEFARANGIELTTIHPAAVYGGRNTGGGITDYMENLASRNWHRLPFINPSSFPGGPRGLADGCHHQVVERAGRLTSPATR